MYGYHKASRENGLWEKVKGFLFRMGAQAVEGSRCDTANSIVLRGRTASSLGRGNRDSPRGMLLRRDFVPPLMGHRWVALKPWPVLPSTLWSQSLSLLCLRCRSVTGEVTSYESNTLYTRQCCNDSGLLFSCSGCYSVWFTVCCVWRCVVSRFSHDAFCREYFENILPFN